MIIKDDKVVEPSAEQVTETLPPYSPRAPEVRAPEVRIAVVDQTAPPASQLQVLPNDPGIRFRPRGPSSASLTPSTTARDTPPVPASSSSAYSGYSGSTSNSTVRPPETYQSVPPPPGVPRTGFLRVRRENKPISQRIVVDPYLPFPPSALQDISAGQGRRPEDDDDEEFGPRFGSPVPGDPEQRNVRLECKTAHLSAEVWVVGRDIVDIGERRKAGIDVRAKNGFIRVKVHTSPSSPSFSLRVACKNGGVRVALPRTFYGPLTTRSHNGWVSLSPALASCTTAFSEVCGIRKSFVGDFAESGYGRGEWHGSSVDITCSNGRIKLCYLDEDGEKSNSGFFACLFS